MRVTLPAFAALFLCACGGGGGGGSSSTPAPTPINRAPIANDVSALTRPDTAINGSLSATDLDGDSLSFALGTAPANGTVVLSGTGDRDFEYTPNTGFVGVDSFTFTASDGTATSNTATATMTVNTRPEITSAGFSTSDLGTVSGSLVGSDADGDTLTYAVATPPAKGTVTSLDAATGAFVYTPDLFSDGADSFEITASDAAEASVPGIVDIEIFGWAGTQQFGSAQLDTLATKGLIIFPNGEQLMSGYTEGQVGSAANAGGRDGFLRRTDRRGNQLSIVQFGGAGDDVPRGLFERPQGDGYYLVVASPDDNIYRFNSDGAEIFSVPLPVNGGLNVVAEAYWSGVDADGDIYTVSWVDPPAPSSGLDALVSKISGNDGSLIWQRQLLTSETDAVNPFIDETRRISPRGIDFDTAGNPVITGEHWDSMGSRTCVVCGFIAKLDAETGADVWVREPDAFASCGVDGSGRLYRVSVAADDTLYVNGIANLNMFPGNDAYFARYSADGTQELWGSCDDSGEDTSLAFTNPVFLGDGTVLNYVFVADVSSPPDMNGNPSKDDLFLYKFDSDGNIIWTARIEATRADGSGANISAGDVAEDGQGILYITGFTDGELTGSANAGEDDAFVMRLGPDGTIR